MELGIWEGKGILDLGCGVPSVAVSGPVHLGGELKQEGEGREELSVLGLSPIPSPT